MNEQQPTLELAEWTAAEQAAPCPDLPVYDDDDLGAFPDGKGATFRIWAPTAESVTLRLFAAGSPEDTEDPQETHELTPGSNGTWLVRCDGIGHGIYYAYLVRFPDGTVHRCADPWARAAGVNGRRSMVVDLTQTNPEGWSHDRRPRIPSNALVIWETHIGDFSNDEHSGIPKEHRGTYLAFTDENTSVDGRGEFPTCMSYLKRLGITAVQLLPFYDYGSVDESLHRDDPERDYNWAMIL